FSDLHEALETDPNTIVRIIAPDPYDPNGPLVAYDVEDVFVDSSGGRTITWDSSEDPLPGGVYYKNIKIQFISDGGGQEITPLFCCSGDSQQLAEDIKGYILEIHDNRLFIAGNLEDRILDRIWYSKKAQQFSTDATLPIHVGDFFITDARRTAIDAD